MGLVGFGVTLLFLQRWQTMSRFFTDFKGAFAAMGAMAVGMTNTGIAQTLMSLTPILILWPSRLMFGTKVSMQELVGAIIAVAGASLFFL